MHICMPVSERQMRNKLGMPPQKVLKAALDCAEFARGKGYEICIGLEDATRADPRFLLRVARVFREHRIPRVRLSDTVGILTPGRTGMLVRMLMEESLSVEFHGHNDLSMAEANSLCAAIPERPLWIRPPWASANEREIVTCGVSSS